MLMMMGMLLLMVTLMLHHQLLLLHVLLLLRLILLLLTSCHHRMCLRLVHVVMWLVVDLSIVGIVCILQHVHGLIRELIMDCPIEVRLDLYL